MKKNIIILTLVFIIIIMSIIIGVLLINNSSDKDLTKNKNSSSIDGSEMSSSELVKMFEKEGYKITLTKFTDNSAIYISLENKKEGITVQRIINTLIGTLMTFDDDNINQDTADLLDTSRNNSDSKKQQYKAYQNWIEKYNITKLQLSNMLEDYYYGNLNKVEILNLDEILNN